VQTLNLSDQKPARGYACDHCGRDLTKYLDRGHAHSFRILGPPAFICSCGQRFATGAQEWDYLDRYSRSNLLLMGPGLGAVAGLALIAFCSLVYFVAARHSVVLFFLSVTALAPTAVFVPLATAGLLQTMEIAASLWRTRILGLLRLRSTHGRS
jgi:hypothetical protein